MPDRIEIQRCTLNNGFDLVAELASDRSHVGWTLRSPHDRTIQPPLTAAEAHLLLQVHHVALKGRRMGIWVRGGNDDAATPVNLNRQRVNPSMRVAFDFELVPCPGRDGLTEGRYELHHASRDNQIGGPCGEARLARDHFNDLHKIKVLIDGDSTHSYAIVAMNWNMTTKRVEVAIKQM